MGTQEFYIRQATETDARGPFTREQLLALAENGEITPAILYYEATTEVWTPLAENGELKAALFPSKKKSKAREAVATKPPETAPATPVPATGAALYPLSRRQDSTLDRNARFGLYATATLLILSCAALAFPSSDVLVSGSLGRIFGTPFLLLGLIDLVLGLLVFLQIFSLAPFIRLRALLGLGFVGFIFWTQGQPLAILAAAAGYLGLYFCTVFSRATALRTAAAVGLLGMLGLAYHTLA